MLNVPLATAQELQLLTTLASQFAPGDRSFITPLWPGAYAALGRKAPLREIFALQPRSEVFEKDEVERIKYANPGFAIVPEGLVDGQSDRRFRETHPLTHQYIMDHFEPLPTCLPYFTCYKHK